MAKIPYSFQLTPADKYCTISAVDSTQFSLERSMKPLRIITLYGGYSAFEKTLRDNSIVFSVRDCFSGFWGKEFYIEKPRGKGATAKISLIWSL